VAKVKEALRSLPPGWQNPGEGNGFDAITPPWGGHLRISSRVSTALIVAILAACATDAGKKRPKWHPQPATSAELAEIAHIEATGREIYRLDQLVWHASDALAFAGALDHPAAGTGYAVSDTAAGARVAFLLEDGQDIRLLADVDMADAAHPKVERSSARPLDEDEIAKFRARQTALKAAPNLCEGPRNTVVLPVAGGAWDVYVLAASKQGSIVPMGGHARLRVSAEGTSVLALEPYSKTCINMNTEGQKMIALMVTHVVSDLPAPTHVFLSLTYPKTMMVATHSHLWRVADGSIVAVPP